MNMLDFDLATTWAIGLGHSKIAQQIIDRAKDTLALLRVAAAFGDVSCTKTLADRLKPTESRNTPNQVSDPLLPNSSPKLMAMFMDSAANLNLKFYNHQGSLVVPSIFAMPGGHGATIRALHETLPDLVRYLPFDLLMLEKAGL